VAIDGPRNYRVYRTDSGEQVAYARVITDGATFAWLWYVFVDSSVRGLRTGIALVETVGEALGGFGLKRIEFEFTVTSSVEFVPCNAGTACSPPFCVKVGRVPWP
jgi:hypothetical protein